MAITDGYQSPPHICMWMRLYCREPLLGYPDVDEVAERIMRLRALGHLDTRACLTRE